MLSRTIGFRVESEPNTHTGRPDLIVDTGKQIFVIELKLNKTAALALDQITKKWYYEKHYHKCAGSTAALEKFTNVLIF